MFFPKAVLGSDVVMLKGALTGGLEMAVSSSPNLTWVVPSLMVFDLPYITSVKYQKNLYECVVTVSLAGISRENSMKSA